MIRLSNTDRSVEAFGWSIGREHDFRVNNLVLFSAVVFVLLVILGKQFFSGLVGGSGNGRVAFASLNNSYVQMGYWHFV